MKGLILAGGLGTRLRPFSHTEPKQLIPVANKPIIHYIVEDLKNSGIIDIGVIVGYTEERINAIKNSLGDGNKFGVNITYIQQDAPRGLAHAVSIAEDFINKDDFVVYLGDNLLIGGIKSFIEPFRNADLDATILLSQVENPSLYGVVSINNENDIIEIEEKPENPKSNLAIIGIYLFRKSIFKFINDVKPGKHGELQLTDAIKNAVNSRSHKLKAYAVNNWWDDLGRSEDVLHANNLILSTISKDIKGIIEEDVKIVGNVQVGKDSIIKKGSVIRGPAIIGENCEIGPNTYIGPSTSIGNNCKIINTEIDHSVILDNAIIDIKEKIVDSLICKNAMICSDNKLPKGHRFIVGENSEVRI